MRGRVAAALVICISVAGFAKAQPAAFFSATGTFSVSSGQSTDFNFALANTSSLTLRTQAASGGTNFAGQSIASGGIDSILTLYNGGGTQIAQDDDAVGQSTLDSLLSATGTGSSLLSPQAAGNYRLRLTNFGATVGDGHWSTDLGFDAPFFAGGTINGITTSANSVIKTLAWGANNSTGDATLALGAGTGVSVTGGVTLLNDAHLILSGGTLTTPAETIGGPNNGGANVNQSAGTHIVNGNASIGIGTGFNALYDLSGGTFQVNGQEYVADGFSSFGTFNQFGGYHQASQLFIAYQTTTTGTYNLSAGSLVSGQTVVGYGGTGTFNQSGGTASLGQLVAGWAGTATLNQTAGALTANAGATIGGPASAGATWSIGSLATSSVSGTLDVENRGAVFLNGGSLSVGTVSLNGSGTFSFPSGTLNITNDNLTVGTFGLLGPSVALSPARILSVSGTTTIAPNATLTLNGGTFSTGSLANNGANFNFPAGTLRITASNLTIGAAGPFGTSYSLDAGHRIDTTGSNNLTVDAAAILALNGGSMNLGGGAVNNGQLLFTSPLSILTGGTLSNGGLVSGTGRVAANLGNAVSGEVRASSSDALRFLAPANTNAGSINLFGGLVEFTGTLNNAGTGRITGHGQLLVHGGLTNNGSLVFSSSESDVTGGITNTGTGKTIVTGGATATFYDPVVNGGSSEFRVSTASTAVFLGNVTGLAQFTGPGVKDFEAGASAGAIATTTGSTIVGPSAVVTAQYVRENALTVEGNAAILANGTSASTSRVNSLSIDGGPGAWTGRLDLNDNDLVIHYSSGSPIATVANQIKSGYANGSWTGKGITSTAAAVAANAAHHTALGFAEALDLGVGSFSGQSVDNTSLLVRYTLAGDSNLDGTVDLTDFTYLAANFNATNRTWLRGDYNYDGVVDLTDFTLLASNFNQTLPAAPTTGLGTSVPEPSAVFVVFASAATTLVRRRRP
jgi:hypothetical protein